MAEDKEKKDGVFNVVVKNAVVKGLGGLFKSALGSNLKGFFKNGLAFSCLGNQAFNNKDYQQALTNFQNHQAKMNAIGTEEALIDIFDWANSEIVYSDILISEFRSTCSKQLREQFKKDMQSVVETGKSMGFVQRGTKQKEWGGRILTIPVTILDENSEAYRAEERKHLPVVTPPAEPVGEPTSNLFEDLEGLDTEIADDLTSYVVAPEAGTPTRSGNIRVGVEGDGFEGTLATGRYANQNNTLLYLLVGFGIMYFLTKKR